ncbi:MAG: hypothetical protein V3T23_11550 [Nitrososphaerales archaeon]
MKNKIFANWHTVCVTNNWKRQLATEGEVAFPGKGRMTLEQEEVRRLRGENRRLRMERNILKKRRPSSPRNRAEICIYGGAGLLGFL